LMKRPLEAELIAAEIDRYDGIDAGRVTELIRKVAGLEQALDRYEALYREVLVADADPAAWEAQLGEGLRGGFELERSHRRGRESPPMEMTTIEAGRRIEWRVPESARFRELAADAEFQLAVEIVNRSPITLSSCGAMPVRLSYHWLPQEPG